jgi:hypothetical protein
MELFSLRKICRICPRHRGPGPPAPAHGSTDFIKCWSLATGLTTRIKLSKSVSRLLISVVHHRSDGWDGRLGLARVRVYSSYDGRFSMRFAPMGSQRRGERVYANLNRHRATTKPDNGEAARPVLGDGEGGPRWSFGSKDVHQGFLELPSSFLTNQLLWSAMENSNLVAT